MIICVLFIEYLIFNTEHRIVLPRVIIYIPLFLLYLIALTILLYMKASSNVLILAADLLRD